MGNCIFNSKFPEHKQAFGAVIVGENVKFTVNLPKSIVAQEVSLLIHEDYMPEEKIVMDLVEITPNENIYCCNFVPKSPKLYFYYFGYIENYVTHVIRTDDQKFAKIDSDGGSWQLTVYQKETKVPDCFGDGIIYQIFPDRFCNSGTPKKNVPKDRILRSDWGSLPQYLEDEKGVFACNDYFGGDLKGIQSKLDYLQNLGVTCIYINPIFESHSNHRYNVADYNKIDPLLGTEDDFKELCAEAKKRGISIILDGVFSHTGSDSIYFNKNGRYGEKSGAFRDPQSPYKDWYKFKNYPNDYECWWGFQTLPNVNEENKSYLDFVCRGENSVVKHWLDAGAAGFRLDVADELPDMIIDELYKTVKAHSEDCCLIGEVWEDASNKIAYDKRRRYLLGGQLDSVMNYPFRNCVLDYVRDGKDREFLNTVNNLLENYPPSALNCAMNSLSTHDTERALTYFVGEPTYGRNRIWQAEHHYLSTEQYLKGVSMLKVAACLQYFLPGIPCLYYGDEAGLSGYSDPFNRCCYPWDNEDYDLVEWFCKLGQLRKKFKFLKDCSFIPLCINRDVCAYIRKENSENQILVVVNRSNLNQVFKVPNEFKDFEKVELSGSLDSYGNLEGYSALVFCKKS